MHFDFSLAPVLPKINRLPSYLPVMAETYRVIALGVVKLRPR